MNLYFIVCFLQLVLIRVDSQLLETTREIKERVNSSVLVISIGSIMSISSYYITESFLFSLVFLIFSRSILFIYFSKNIKKYLYIYESELIRPDNWSEKVHDLYDRIFTWNDDYINSPKYIKSGFTIPRNII